MSEYDRLRRIARKMGVSREQAREQAQAAFAADLAAGRGREALKCAEEFRLGEEAVTRAAVSVFEASMAEGSYDRALKTAEGYNLIYADYARRHFDPATLLGGNQVKVPPGQAAPLKRLLELFALGRQRVGGADVALELIHETISQHETDPNRDGRCVTLPDSGDVYLLGDLHGSVDNLIRGAARADLANNPGRHLIVQEIVHSRLMAKDQRDLSFVAILVALRLKRDYPQRVQILLGNHDLGLYCGRDLVKGGKSLNGFLYRGMEHMFGARYEKVLDAYRELIKTMPAAVRTHNGIFMAHSTPPLDRLGRFSSHFLSDGEGAVEPLRRCREVHALVNGRDYRAEAADAFAERVGAEYFICGHTPSWDGWSTPSARHLIIDSQHMKGCYVRFDLDYHYESLEELRAGGVARLDGKPLEDPEVAARKRSRRMSRRPKVTVRKKEKVAAPAGAGDSSIDSDATGSEIEERVELLGEVEEL